MQEAVALSDQKLAQTHRLSLALQANTQFIMDFYDSSLAAAIDHDNCIGFQQALSSVGEAMAERFALEDRLIRLVIEKE